MKQKIALVTGAAGFLGSWLICYLLKNSPYQVFALVRSTSADRAKSRIHRILKFIPHNLNQRCFERL